MAKGHVAALKKLEKEGEGLYIYNLGTGNGYSVLDIVKAFAAANGVTIPYTIKPRRAGDIATCYADPKKAKEELVQGIKDYDATHSQSVDEVEKESVENE